MTMSPRAQAWLDSGSFYTWTPPASGGQKELRIFHREAGALDAPLLMLVHGFPTSSIDWFDVFDALVERYRVSVLDFPGYGFSDKPRDWPYSLQLDAELLVHHLVRVLGADSCRLVAHDRGDSVVLLLHQLVMNDGEDVGTTLEHLVITNGNVFLPLSHLTEFQKRLLDPSTAEEVLALTTPELLAEGLGGATFTPPRNAADPTVAALASTFAYNGGVAVLHDTIQYLRERADNEIAWLDSLARSEVPSTMIWGICDAVSPPRVVTHVWERFLRHKPGSNEFWILPGANHYLQNDRPDAFVDALLQSLDRSGPVPPGPLAPNPTAAVRVDHSAPSLRSATDVFGP